MRLKKDTKFRVFRSNTLVLSSATCLLTRCLPLAVVVVVLKDDDDDDEDAIDLDMDTWGDATHDCVLNGNTTKETAKENSNVR